MSNRVDFFQPSQGRLAVPAGRVCVYVEGALCPCLEVVEVVRGEWGEFSRARLAYNCSSYPQGKLVPPEEIERKIAIGSRVWIGVVYNRTFPGASAHSLPIFAGHVERVETKIGPDGEFVEVIARDFSVVLERVTVYGRWVRDVDGRIVFLAGADTVFNENGECNATVELVEHNGSSVRLFAASGLGVMRWSYADVIHYLLSEYVPAGQLGLPGGGQLRALTEDQDVRDLDVTGLSILEALRRCCERAGLEFKFVPRLCETGPEERIVLYRVGRGREVELDLQGRGEQFSISKTNIFKLESERDFWPVTHRYIGQGDYKVFEATFELVKAWDPGLESWDYEQFSPSTNPDFVQIKDVYRKWCLNEGGAYSGEPYNCGEAFDFSQIFEHNDYVHQRRRFWPALSRDAQGKSLGYVLEISYNDGQHWWPYPFALNTLLDECGIWLSSDRLDPYVWVAALKGVLRLRMTASVVSDERLSCVVADGPVDSAAAVVDHVITLPRQFKYRKVSGRSLLASSTGASGGKADEVDDTDALYEYVRTIAKAGAATIEKFDVQTPYLCFGFEVGDRVSTSPESRDIFSVRRDNRSVAWIERVRMDFERQLTELRVVRRRRVDV